MKYLDDIAEAINTAVDVKKSLIYGIVRQANHGKEGMLIDKNGGTISFSNEFNAMILHSVNSSSLDELNIIGKKKRYNIVANIDLVAYSTLRNFDEYMLGILGQFPHITVRNVDYDGYRILKNTFGQNEFDFNKYIFKINYEARKVTDLCFDCTLLDC